MVDLTWPYLLGSLARLLRRRSRLSLDVSQEERSENLPEKWHLSQPTNLIKTTV